MSKVIPQPEITRETFVGRDAEMKVINDAISDEMYLRVVNIQGVGGIGKTSLLHEVQRRYGKQDDLLVTGIIDFFDIATHTSRGFLYEVVRELSKESEELFTEYREAQDSADEIELAGITGDTLEKARRNVQQAFEKCYNALAADKRIVLLIDTFEVVQHILREWLADWLVGLNNTVVIIAGRKNRDWQDDLVTKVGSKAVDYLELKEFTPEETRELFMRSVAGRAEAGRAISDKERQKLQLLTGGRPVLLTLALDWQMRENIPQQALTTTSSQHTLNDLQAMTLERLGQEQKIFSTELVRRFSRDLHPHDPDMRRYGSIINCMALVYKYFTVDTLAYLFEITEGEAQALLDKIADWTFIKYDKHTGAYQLHDLVRDLIMDYVWPDIDKTGDERKNICRNTVKFYDRFLADIEKQEVEWQAKRRQAEEARDRGRELVASRELIDLKRRRQRYEAQRVYYDIIADHKDGLIQYREFVFVDNVWAREREAYQLAQQERDLALEMIELTYPNYQRELEKARIAIVVEGKFDGGLDILEPMLSEIKLEDASHLYTDILLYQGIAYTYKGEYEQAEDKLRDTIKNLEDLEEELEDPSDPENLDTIRVARSLGRAYGNLGYTFMMAGRISEAVEAYQEARRYQELGNLEVAGAATLNELGYSYAKLGKPERGRRLCQKGLEIREKLLLDYYVGLSYNTRGLIEYLADDPNKGKSHSEKALTIFKRIGDPRGIGLARRALGALLGRIGQRESSIDVLREAEEHLKFAEETFKEGGAAPEPSHLADTFEKLGLLYHDWGNLLQAQGSTKDIVNKHLRRSEDYFRRCIEEYRREQAPWNQATALERLSGLFFDMQDFDKAKQTLDEFEVIVSDQVPQDFFLPAREREKPIDKIEFKRHEFLYPLGKLERGKARLAFLRYLESKKVDGAGELSYLKRAAKQYALACAYLELYSRRAYARGATLDEVVLRIEQLSMQEIAEFKKQVEVTQCEYGLESYPAILEWIEDVTGVM